MKYFANIDLHVSLVAEPVAEIGGVVITNSMVFGAIGLLITIALCFYAARKVRRGETNFFVGLFKWMFEGLRGQVHQMITDEKLARKMTPLAITIFIFVLVNYWMSVLPGVGTIVVNGDVPIFRALVADLNFTVGLALISIAAVQIYAVQSMGFFTNIGRYIRNPLKDPIGAFEGVLELIGEFSRALALSMRLFASAFAGEILLIVAAVMSGFMASLVLPVVMAFELFIGFIQAYVFFMLTLLFTAMAQAHAHHDEADHKPADTAKMTAGVQQE